MPVRPRQKIRPLDLGETAIKMLHAIGRGRNIYQVADADYYRDLSKKFPGIVTFVKPYPKTNRDFPEPVCALRCTRKGLRMVSHFLAGVNKP